MAAAAWWFTPPAAAAEPVRTPRRHDASQPRGGDVHEHGLDVEVLAVGAGCIALWALTARRLAGWNVSSAMAMVVLGLVVANEPLDLIAPSPTSATVRLLVELTLALVLFSDASRVNLRGLRGDPALPARLLLDRAAPHDRARLRRRRRSSPISIRGCAPWSLRRWRRPTPPSAHRWWPTATSRCASGAHSTWRAG